MGQEAICSVRFGGRVTEGKALLETKSVIFRGGEFRLNIPYQALRSVEASGGTLRLCFADGLAEFDLGGKAEKWAHAIQNPKGLLDKLGVKEGLSVAISGPAPESFLRELEGRGCSIGPKGELRFLFIENQAGLKKVRASGPLWIVYPKGRKEITQADVMSAGKAAGLVDIKVASFSETHTALKFVIRRS